MRIKAGFPLGYRLIAQVLTAAGINLCAAAAPGLNPGPPSAGTETITVMAETPLALFVGMSGGGLYRSLDHGKSWNEVLRTYGSAFRVLDFSGPVLIAAAGEDLHLPYASPIGECHPFLVLESCIHDETQRGGLYLSRDGGTGWEGAVESIPADPPPRLLNIGALVRKADTLFAASPRGLYVSEDKGENWNLYSRREPNPQANNPFLSPRFGRNSVRALEWIDSTLFALTDSALYASTVNLKPGWQYDAPNQWREMPMHGEALAKLGKWLFLSTADGMKRSKPAGESWQPLAASPVSQLQELGNKLYGVRGKDVLVSADSGLTWSRAMPAAPQDILYLLPRQDHLYAALDTRGEPWISRSGDAFKPLADGPHTLAIEPGGAFSADHAQEFFRHSALRWKGAAGNWRRLDGRLTGPRFTERLP